MTCTLTLSPLWCWRCSPTRRLRKVRLSHCECLSTLLVFIVFFHSRNCVNPIFVLPTLQNLNAVFFFINSHADSECCYGHGRLPSPTRSHAAVSATLYLCQVDCNILYNIKNLLLTNFLCELCDLSPLCLQGHVWRGVCGFQ